MPPVSKYNDCIFWIPKKLCTIIDRDTFHITIFQGFKLVAFKTRQTDDGRWTKGKEFTLSYKDTIKELDYWKIFDKML